MKSNLPITQVNEVGREMAGMQRKILGSWKQYSGREFSELFSVDSGRIRPEIIGKNPGNFRREYCFHIPDISCVSLQDPVTFPHISCKIRWQERSPWVVFSWRRLSIPRNNFILIMHVTHI